MTWKEALLGELIHIRHGYAFKSEYFSDNGKYVVLTPGNFYEQGGFKYRPGKDRYYVGTIPENFILSSGDLIIAMTEQGPGLLGSAALIPDDDTYLHNQRLGLIDTFDQSQINIRFLYYLFNTANVRGQISGSATGTKVKHTAPERVYRVKVKIPSVSEQEKISNILMTYDALIENNNRRIALLEESTRLLYREWFVNLRFPGHQHVKIVDGVPEGWKPERLNDIGYLNYGKALKADSRIDGPYPVYGSSGIVGFHDKALVEGPGIILGRKGNVGSVYWSQCDFHPIDTVYYIDTFQSNLFLFYALKCISFISTDVAVPGLNRDFAHSRQILCPDRALIDEFNQIAQQLHEQISILERQSDSCSKARDLLLPRLMNGEIAV